MRFGRIRRIQLSHKDKGLLALCLLLFALSHAAIFYGQFTGEDEALQWYTSRRLLGVVYQNPSIDGLRKVLRILQSEYHPPLRYLLSMPGVLLFPRLEVGVRLGAVLGSLMMTGLLGWLGYRIGGRKTGWATALLVSASAIYQWTSMAFAWSILVCGVVGALHLLWHPVSLTLETPSSWKRLWAAFACLFVAYLVNSGAILFSVGLVLLLVMRHVRRLPRLVLLGLPVAAVYGLYWLLFLVLPAYSGQLFQTERRFAEMGWTVSSFWENLRGWFTYGFPIFFNLLWITGLVACARVRSHFLWILLPFCLAWSFWFQSKSHQYFLLGTLPLIPFGIHYFIQRIDGWMPIWWATALVFAWNVTIFQWPYPASRGILTAVHPVLDWMKAYGGRYHNSREPYHRIAQRMQQVVAHGETYLVDLKGPFDMFYFPAGPARLGRLGESPYTYDNKSRQLRYTDVEAWPAVPDWILTPEPLHGDMLGAPETWAEQRYFLYPVVVNGHTHPAHYPGRDG